MIRSMTYPESYVFSRQGSFVIPLSVIIYILLQYSIMSSSLCTTAESYAPWALNYYFAMSFTFFVAAFEQMMKMWMCHKQSRFYHRLLYMTAFAISIIAGSSNMLTYTHGGVCKDALGVESPVAQWSEWIVSVPLMVYINIAVEDKNKELINSDLAVIMLTSVSIILGFMMNFHVPFTVGVIFFSLAILCFIAYPSYLMKFSGESNKVKFSLIRSNLSIVETRIREEEDLIKATKYKYLSRLLFTLFPLFPFTYLLAYMKILDRDQAIVTFGMGGIITKMLFANILVDAKVGLSDRLDAERKSRKSAEVSRNTFLRYVFHELRTPLHTLTMGMTVIENKKKKKKMNNNDEEEKEIGIEVRLKKSRHTESREEVVNMMQGATDFMSNTLNDVLLIHNIQEGSYEITKNPFHLHDVIGIAVHTLQNELGLKDINVTIDNTINTAFPDRHLDFFLGDRSKLEAIVVDFLSHAIKRSTIGSNIDITIVKKFKIGELKKESFHVWKKIKDIFWEFFSALNKCFNPYYVRTVLTAESSLKGSIFPIYDQNCGNGDDVGGVYENGNYIDINNNNNNSNDNNNNYNNNNNNNNNDNNDDNNKNNNNNNNKVNFMPTICEVTLTIEDSGTSITEEDIIRLLTPYSQIRPNQNQNQNQICNEQGRDTGLWLLLAKEIIVLHNGHLIADSNPNGTGNVFGFKINFQLTPSLQPIKGGVVRINHSDSQILSHTNEGSCLVRIYNIFQNNIPLNFSVVFPLFPLFILFFLFFFYLFQHITFSFLYFKFF